MFAKYKRNQEMAVENCPGANAAKQWASEAPNKKSIPETNKGPARPGMAHPVLLGDFICPQERRLFAFARRADRADRV